MANIRGRSALGQAPADGDVGDRRDRPGTEALDEPGDDEDPIDGARPPISRPIANSPRPSANGRPSPPRSMTPPTTAMPISEPRKNAVKTQP